MRHLVKIITLLLSIGCSIEIQAMEAPKPVGKYEIEIRALFANGEWDHGKQLLDEAMMIYSDMSVTNELMGEYFLHIKEYDKARFFLVRALRLNEVNSNARYLLVRIETDTKNYSSAICYINELLETQPYDRELWFKRIGLYRLQGNDMEANRELKRLHLIFPNDSVVTRLYLNTMEEHFQKVMRKGDDIASEEALRTLITADPKNPKYYIQLCNMYAKQGNKAMAIAVADEGIIRLHGNDELLRKKIGMLDEQKHYNEALGFLRNYKSNYGGDFEDLKKYLEEEAARDAVNSDPYVLQGKRFEETKDPEVLNYLVNTSYTREYNSDAIYYLGEALKKKHNDKRLLYMQYTVNRRMGNRSKAIAILRKVYDIDTTDKEIADELACHYMEDVREMMVEERYDEALPLLDFIIDNDTTTEQVNGAMSRKVACLTKLNQNEEALELLQQSNLKQTGEKSYYVRQAELLSAMNRNDEAMELLEYANRDYDISETYEEITLPYIKELIDEGAIRKAHSVCYRLLALCPNSKQGMMYHMTTCDLLGKDREFALTVKKARRLYPDDVDILVKQVAVYNKDGRYDESLNLMTPLIDTFSMNKNLINAYSATTDLKAQQLLKDRESRRAIELLDSALYHDPLNRTLLYDKGLAYEKLRIFDSAAYYQKYYSPSLIELSEFMRQTNGLRYSSLQNDIQVNYMHSKYGFGDNQNGLAGVNYHRSSQNDVYGGYFYYAGRDGNAENESEHKSLSGGIGIQILAEWRHKWNEKISTEISGGLANKYFPTWQASLKGEYYAKNEWTIDVHGSYRRIIMSSKVYKFDSIEGWIFDHWDVENGNLFSLGAGVLKDFMPFRVSGKVDGLLVNRKIYANASVQGTYFPTVDKISSILMQMSIGNAPEAMMLNMGLPGGFNHVNTSVGFGATYLFTQNLMGMVMGTWQVFYNDSNYRLGNVTSYTDNISTDYRNLFCLYMQLDVKF